jgi:hypothetical protein
MIALVLAGAAVAFPSAAGHVAATANAPAGHHDPLFFSMQIADERGEILAEPKLLGMCGVPLEMRLSDPQDLRKPKMSLRLLPDLQQDGRYEIAFELSVSGRIDKSTGTISVRPGEERSARVDYPGGHIDVQLAAFTVSSPEFELYLQHGMSARVRPART